MNKVNLKLCAKICNECPFSKKSLPGYLGGFTIETTLEAQQMEVLFSCHLHRTEDLEDTFEKTVSGDIPICRGYVVSASKSCKSFGQSEAGKYLKVLQTQISKEEYEEVLNRQEFREHHGKFNA